MPCRYDPSPAEIKASRERDFEIKSKPLRDSLDKLTHENDQLREFLIAMLIDWEGEFGRSYYALDEKFEKILHLNQEKHRKEDLKRLKSVFIKSKDAEKLGLVMLADPKKPLEPQIGFDPDAY